MGGKGWALMLGHEGDGWLGEMTQSWDRVGLPEVEKVEE